MAGTLGVGWPMRLGEDGLWHFDFTKPAAAALPIQWLFMVDLGAWECMIVSEWFSSPTSPIAAHIATDAKVLPLKEGLAWQAFGSLPTRPLKQLAKHLGAVEVADLESLHDILVGLVSHILGIEALSDEMLLILDKRVAGVHVQVGLDILEATLIEEEAEITLNKFDEEDLQNDLAAAKSAASDLEAYQKEVTNSRKGLHEKKVSAAKKPAERKKLENPFPKWRGPVKTPQGSGALSFNFINCKLQISSKDFS